MTNRSRSIPGRRLRDQFDLRAGAVEEELIKKAFIPLARTNKYPEAATALMDATNNWIAERDGQTAYVPVKVSASSPAAGSRTGSSPASKRTSAEPNVGATTAKSQGCLRAPCAPGRRTSRSAAPPEPAAQAHSSSGWMAASIVWILILAFVLLLLATIWVKYKRSKSRVAGRLKEIRSHAVDVMDRLDALKERLKLLPTSPEFKAPMAGQTQVLYNGIQDKVAHLWDGWLTVMETLEKATKLSDRAGSPFAQKTLDQAEKLIERQGSFQEIEKQATAIASDVDRLDHAHQAARAGARRALRQSTKAGCTARRDQELRLADRALRRRARRRHRRDVARERRSGRRSAGNARGPGTTARAVRPIPGSDRARGDSVHRCP